MQIKTTMRYHPLGWPISKKTENNKCVGEYQNWHSTGGIINGVADMGNSMEISQIIKNRIFMT